MTFVDTSYLIAGMAADDDHHGAATRLEQSLAGRALITTNLVRGETWTFLRRRYGHRVACAFLRHLDSSAHLDVDHVGEDLEEEALAWLRRHDEREYSFVDATSFAFMRRNGITDALAFDGDFAAAGFNELRP